MRFRMRSRARLFTTVVIAAGAAATLGVARTPALAQGYFFWGGETEPRAEPPRERKPAAQPPRPAARKKVSRNAPEGGAAARQAKPEAAQLDRPLFVIASIADQHVSIYNHRGLVARSAISTGIAGHPTPKGIFSIIGRERYHRSNIYSGAPMPFMQRITWSGIAMHLGVVPGHPASHGCIRLPAAFAAKLWGMTRIGERVVISPHDVSPSEFDHPLLPAPKMRAAEPDKLEPAPLSAQPPQAGADRPSNAPQQQAEKSIVETDPETASPAKSTPDIDSSDATFGADPSVAAAPPQSEQSKADVGVETVAGAKAAPAADLKQQPPAEPAAAANPQQQAERLSAGVISEAAAATNSTPVADPQPAPNADAPAIAQQKSEEPRLDATEKTAETVDAASSADPLQQPAPVAAAESGVADPQPQANQPKIEAGAEKPATSAGSRESAAAKRLTVNPHLYAQQLKAKAAADVAAANNAVRTLSAEAAAKQKEAARAAAELSAAEAAHASARAKADAAAASQKGAAAASASQKEPTETAERGASAGDARAKTNADRLTIAYGRALLAEDAALLAKTNAESALAEAGAKLEQARAASAARDTEFADIDRRLEEARAAAAVAATAEREAQRRAAPVSVLISRKERKIYVRQGLSPLFDAPVEIRDPDAPLGSHLYIATAANEDGTSLKWSVVSMPVRAADAQPNRRKDLASVEARADVSWDWRPSGASPAEALERVEIPKDVRDRIAERLWTGASLIITDLPVSGETGNDGTDLTIKLR
jgi:lipoprotein-anchoring transpeptidase ErfK/SrfK